MQELLTQVMLQLRSAWRFRWIGLGLAWVGCIGGWFWAASQPNVYEAGARVYVDASSVLRPLLRNRIVPEDVGTELVYVRQALLGREHLERVAHENNLDARATTPQALEAVVAGLRSGLVVENFSLGRDTPSAVYIIRYRHSRRDTAVGVVSSLLNALVEGTLGASRTDDTAESFVEARIEEYESRLRQAEEALANFKRENVDMLPGVTGGYYERRAAQREALDAARKALQVAQSRRDQLQAQLSSESPVMPAGAGVAPEPPANSLDARIRDARARLDMLSLQYTDRHPDVIAERNILARLEEQRVAELAALGVTNVNTELSSLDSNPIYQALQIALNEAHVEVATLEADVRDRAQRLEEIQALIDEVPVVEAELTRLNRDYDVVYEQYQALIRSREVQDLTRKVSDTERIDFRVIDPPSAPVNPVAPDRLRLLAMVFFGALMAAGGVCYLLAQLKPVFASTKSLREVTGLPVLGAISRAWESRTRTRRRLELTAFAAVLGALTALFVVVVAIEVAGPGVHALAEMV